MIRDFRQGVTIQIDFDQSVFQAYMNCINSFQGLETTSENIPQAGINRMVTRVSPERFQFNIGVLDGMIFTWQDDDYKTGTKGKHIQQDMFLFWKEINQLLQRNGFFKRKNLTGEM